MQCMSLTESAVLLGFHPVRMSLFIFCCIIISLLALRARQSNPCSHILISIHLIASKHPPRPAITNCKRTQPTSLANRSMKAIRVISAIDASLKNEKLRNRSVPIYVWGPASGIYKIKTHQKNRGFPLPGNYTITKTESSTGKSNNFSIIWR